MTNRKTMKRKTMKRKTMKRSNKLLGGARKRKSKKSKKSKKSSAWNKHVMSVYAEMKKTNKNTKLKDAMRKAKSTYKK